MSNTEQTEETTVVETTPVNELLETPPEVETDYWLMMNDGDTQQQIDLTRAEYIEVKRHLATLRGAALSIAA